MTPALGLGLVAILIALNGLFVAAEFSLVAVRRGVIEERASAGERRATLALRQLRDLSFVLSAAQFGITVTSLLVGFLAEDAVGSLLGPLADLLPAGVSVAAAAAGAFLLSTMAQMVLGELAPKNLAIARPETVALAVALPTRAFQILFGPIIRVFDTAAAWVSSRMFGIEVTDELVAGHSLDELSRIISASGEEGILSEEQAELLMRAVTLGDRRIGSVMVPRPDVVWMAEHQTLEDLRRTARQSGFSRFPVMGDTEDDVVGTVHIKDLLMVPRPERAITPLSDVAATPLLVPESDTVRRLFARFRSTQRTFAVVVDEYGGTAGIVTLEDLVEELVGEIEDEFDREAVEVRRLGPRRWNVRGTLRTDEVADVLGLELPVGDYETVAGFVLDRLGRIPEPGDRVVHGPWRVTVSRMDGVRVAELRVERLRDDSR